MLSSPPCILGLRIPDHLHAESIDTDAFAQRVASREKLFLGLGANDGDAGVLNLIFRVVKPALRQLERADGKDVGIIAGDVEGERSRLVLDVGLFVGFWGDLQRFAERWWSAYPRRRG